jgi:hypothetical protein
MKVIHIESGLGNQMLSFCEYLAMKKMNPNDECYIETIIYDISECNDIICQWNGYELDRIFHVNAPNIRDIISDKDWNKLMELIRESRFWERNWNYPVYFTHAFHEIGIDLENCRGDFERPGTLRKTTFGESKYQQSFIYRYLRYLRMKKKAKTRKLNNYEKELFISSDKNIFSGQRLTFKYLNSGIEKIEKEIRKTFTFPIITDEKNLKMMQIIQNSESVAIHARRGDMMGLNFDCYVSGYFKRCVKYIRAQIAHPSFFIFCDPESVEWSKHHEKVFGLNFKKDKIYFVDWNKGEDSWRDMQLMAACKHQIITRSSFGWWGAWFNTNPDKITCSPDSVINTNHHF